MAASQACCVGSHQHPLPIPAKSDDYAGAARPDSVSKAAALLMQTDAPQLHRLPIYKLVLSTPTTILFSPLLRSFEIFKETGF